MLRDDRSVAEMALPNARRASDMAIVPIVEKQDLWRGDVDGPVVITARRVNGVLPAGVIQLASLLGDYDMYVQSTVSGNDDNDTVTELSPRAVLSRDRFYRSEDPARVVIAVRLHAALMALAAGNFVIHLAYERKGFAAFEDLGLGDYVFNVNRFDSFLVSRLAGELLSSGEARGRYCATVDSARGRLHGLQSAMASTLKGTE